VTLTHKDKILTIAASRLLQEDLRGVIEDQRIKWRVRDCGITPPQPTSSPIATFFIVSTIRRDYHFPGIDWVQSQKYAGGKYFRVDLTIELELKENHGSSWNPSHVNADNPIFRKYLRAVHMKCRVGHGQSFDNRYTLSDSFRQKSVCDGVYGLIDTPNATWEMANKIIAVMHAYSATQAEIDPH
jgi:hypothetical protein